MILGDINVNVKFVKFLILGLGLVVRFYEFYLVYVELLVDL